ncbi:MAG: hypothetical protein H8E66_16570 [Planctomycetes bacterium]|nr:hypothetical protein [Planctomycetota bacterium]
MASSVIHPTRRVANEHLQFSSPEQYQSDDCPLVDSSRDEFVAHLQHLQDDVLPELKRIEGMLTRVVIANGLDFCHLDLVAKSFLALSQDIRHLLVETEKAAACDERSSNSLKVVQQRTSDSLEHFRDVILSDLTCEGATPVYRHLIATLVQFESEMSRLFAGRSPHADSMTPR